MRVLKFGGTSLADKDAIERVLSIIKNRVKNGQVIIVISALNGVTDQLYKLTRLKSLNDPQHRILLNALKNRHFKLIDGLLKSFERSKVTEQIESTFRELERALAIKANPQRDFKKKQDYIAGFGERLSAPIITACLRSVEIDALYTDTRSLIKTDSSFGSAAILENLTHKNIENYFLENSSSVIVATGFVSSTIDGTPTTLGRGGSDYTASIIGAAVGAKAIEIWTDVDGLMTADPKKVEAASLISRVSYETAKNMSLFGAKVIYPPTIEPAMRFKIPIYIKNTFKPGSPGTIIENSSNIHFRKQYCISAAQNISFLSIQSEEINRIEKEILDKIFLNDKLGITFFSHTKTNTELKFSFSSRDQYLTISNIEKVIDSDLSGIINNHTLLHNLSMITVLHENLSALFHNKITNYCSTISKDKMQALIYDKKSKSLSIFVNEEHELPILNTMHDLFSSIDERKKIPLNEKLYDYSISN